METVKIKTERGRMVIRLDGFFPCSQKKLDKLFRVLREFEWLNDTREISGQMDACLSCMIKSGRYSGKELRRLKKNLENVRCFGKETGG